MKAMHGKRLRVLAITALFAVSFGFGAAQADGKYAEGCAPKSGCQFGGTRFACCVDDS